MQTRERIAIYTTKETPPGAPVELEKVRYADEAIDNCPWCRRKELRVILTEYGVHLLEAHAECVCGARGPRYHGRRDNPDDPHATETTIDTALARWNERRR